jgi:hypothetical protein
MVDIPTSVMGRKPKPQNQRAQPISFSLRPHLIEQIDEYAHDLRFSRSKFLMEAVRKYMIRTDRDSSDDVENMSIDRRFVIGLNALREANQHNVTVKAQLIQMMKDELRITPEEYIEIGQFVEAEESVELTDVQALGDVQFVRQDTKEYGSHVYAIFQQDLRADDGTVFRGSLMKKDIGAGKPQWKWVHGEEEHPPFSILTKAKRYVKEILELV